MSDLFHSARLLYRAVDPVADEELIRKINSDPTTFQNTHARVARPLAPKDVAELIKLYTEEFDLGVVICLIPADVSTTPLPIGTLNLKGTPPGMTHHRFGEIGVMILPEHQGQGFGTEAISWLLDWAFDTAGYHRIGLKSFGWNHGARRLYERIGFRHEGTSKEMMFHQGRFWDDYQFGMLDREWKEIKAARDQVNGKQA